MREVEETELKARVFLDAVQSVQDAKATARAYSQCSDTCM
jgi:hypothetical protein